MINQTKQETTIKSGLLLVPSNKTCFFRDLYYKSLIDKKNIKEIVIEPIRFSKEFFIEVNRLLDEYDSNQNKLKESKY